MLQYIIQCYYFVAEYYDELYRMFNKELFDFNPYISEYH
jgi:hypothetical protein